MELDKWLKYDFIPNYELWNKDNWNLYLEFQRLIDVWWRIEAILKEDSLSDWARDIMQLFLKSLWERKSEIMNILSIN